MLNNIQECCPGTDKIHDWEMGAEPFTYYCYRCNVQMIDDIDGNEPIDFSTEDNNDGA